jgi:hypothetical protein
LDKKLFTIPFYADENPHSKALYETSAAAVGISFFLETETSPMPNQEILLFIDCETNFYKRYYIKGINEVYEIFVSMRILRFSNAFLKENIFHQKDLNSNLYFLNVY